MGGFFSLLDGGGGWLADEKERPTTEMIICARVWMTPFVLAIGQATAEHKGMSSKSIASQEREYGMMCTLVNGASSYGYCFTSQLR